MIAGQLESLDCSVFYDELFEANYLGTAWHATFKQVFAQQCRFVVCLLDHHYVEKIWPTFERESFLPRVAEASVIPIFLDDTICPGIPRDITGILFRPENTAVQDLPNLITDEIVFKLLARLDRI